MLILLYIIIAFFAGCFFTEVAGYFLHILLHSEKVPYLSRNHMVHHLKIYGPHRGLRQGKGYINSVDGRTALFGIGLEWLIPIGLLLVSLPIAMSFMGISYLYQVVFTASALLWGFVLFSYMHDAMHVTDFWMEKNPLFKKWFMNIRKLHDYHHLQLSDDGRMVKNFGICFFFVDRFLGTISAIPKSFNKKGLEAAKKRYAFIYK